ncbi:MAG: DUF1343 domain-containing protein [Bryobacteraceae bacterium]|nr:DUF1343 domain-containing protein [Bryobacteraceae bacterium]
MKVAVPCLFLAAGLWAQSPVDEVIQQAIEKKEIPGAVLLVRSGGKTLHSAAYGSRALLPTPERMTLDTVFDAASLTKVVATTPAVMKLFEAGKIRLNDKVTDYLPEFQDGKGDITIRQLLTHFSGLRPFFELEPEAGYAAGLRKALTEKPVAEPGARFIYSDINFILLGEIVQRVTGRSLAEYVEREVFLPLGMKETRFRPPVSWRARIAPTELVNGAVIRGVVHDERSRYMGGVTGHAGLFTTAADLARFAEMMLGQGTRDRVTVFRPATVEKFTTPQTPPDQPVLRGLGWDIDSPYSSNRGELFALGSYGHTGFTGTSLWIDPHSRTVVILLTNSVHPKRGISIVSLRGKVATVAAVEAGLAAQQVTITGYNEAMAGARREVARNARTLAGIDVLEQQKFASFQGRRVGLITNHTGFTRDGRRSVDALLAGGVKVTALFSPEHGLAGLEDKEDVGHGRDVPTGLPVFSLYEGKNRRPSEDMLRNTDVLVFDIQDIGARFYTYICTMKNAMEEAAKAGLPFVVLDRPNPLTGVRVEGPRLEPGAESFVGCVTGMPLRHGMTVGEIARMIHAGMSPAVNLEVVKMADWQRGDWLDATTLAWVNPSPNMRSLTAALLYPGVAMLEYSKNYSVGRGTDAPFEQIGADWIRGGELASYFNRRMIPGVRVYPVVFVPTSSNLAGKRVEGVRFVVTDREIFDSVRLGVELACALEKLYPGKLDLDVNLRLIGSRRTIEEIRKGTDPRRIIEDMEGETAAFLIERRPFLLY